MSEDHTVDYMSEGQQAMLQYWLEKCDHGGEHIPSRGDMKTSEVGVHFPWVVVFEKLSDPLDFRYRLVGTAITEATFGDYTGKKLSELEGKGKGSKIWALVEGVAERQEPVIEVMPYVGPLNSFSHTTLLALPLAARGKHGEMIMLVADFVRWTHIVGETDAAIKAKALNAYVRRVYEVSI